MFASGNLSQPAFLQSRERPVIFPGKLLDDAARFQFRRQHFPSVSFHFEVRTNFWIFGEQIQNAEQMVVRVFKRRRLRARAAERENESAIREIVFLYFLNLEFSSSASGKSRKYFNLPFASRAMT